MKAYHICYHTDEDGLTAAAVIYEYLKRISKKNARYFFYKINYTIDLKDVFHKDIPAGDEIYFVDYSFSKISNLEYALELSTKDIKVIWLDHHNTSYNIITGVKYPTININDYINFYYKINIDDCAAKIAYEYAFLELNENKYEDYSATQAIYIPSYIMYVDSYDTWSHYMTHDIEFNIGIRAVKNRTPKNVFGSMLKYNNNIINKLFSNNELDTVTIEMHMEKYINNIIEKGIAIKEYQDINNEYICNEYGFEFTLIDKTNNTKRIYSCFAVNKRGNSTIFSDKIDRYDIVVSFQFNGNQYLYSLYTAKDDIDCAMLAEKFGSIDGLGGGGHTKAAGFQTYNQIISSDCTVYITNKLFSRNKYNAVTVCDDK